MLPANQNVFDLFQPSPSVVPLKGQVSWDKIRPAPDETPPHPPTPLSYCTLLLHFPWLAAKSPSSGLRGKTKQILFPSPCFQSSLKFPWHQQIRQGRGGGGVSENVCWKSPPSLLSRCTPLANAKSKGFGLVFSSRWFYPPLTHWDHAFHLWKSSPGADMLACVDAVGTLQLRASHSVYQTRVWLPEIVRLLTHQIHVMSSSRPSLTLLRIWCSSGFHAACPNASFDIQSWNSMMPTITWGRFTG